MYRLNICVNMTTYRKISNADSSWVSVCVQIHDLPLGNKNIFLHFQPFLKTKYWNVIDASVLIKDFEKIARKSYLSKKLWTKIEPNTQTPTFTDRFQSSICATDILVVLRVNVLTYKHSGPRRNLIPDSI